MTNLTPYIENPPVIHAGGTSTVHHISPHTIEYFNAITKPGLVTIETGVGFSTLIFVLNGCDHRSIAPVQQEFDDLLTYFKRNGIDTSTFRPVVRRSEEVLVELKDDKVDIAFIDGRHAFPSPFVDYYYFALMVKKGGLLVVDDVHIWTGKILWDFLDNDPHWALVKNLDNRTVVYSKVSDIDHKEWWGQQPYTVKMSRSLIRNSHIRQAFYLLLTGRWALLIQKLKARMG